jgi:hypothetical protein
MKFSFAVLCLLANVSANLTQVDTRNEIES